MKLHKDTKIATTYIKTTIAIQTESSIRATWKSTGNSTIPRATKAKNPITYIIYSNFGIYSQKKKVDNHYPCKTSFTFYN